MNIYTEVLRDLNGKQSRKVAHNTYLQVRDSETIALRYHATDVVTYHSDGRVVLDTGGWRTSTTKLRFNESYSRLPLRIWADRGVWYVSKPGDWENAVAFADGLTLSPNGDGLYRIDSDTIGEDPKKTQKLRRKVQAYAAGFIASMRAGLVGPPGAGDCLYCQLRTKDGQTMGEVSRDKSPESHLMLHIQEKYYVGSLLVRAMEVMPCSQVMKWTAASKWGRLTDGQGKQSTYEGQDWEWQALQKILARYILRQLGEAV